MATAIKDMTEGQLRAAIAARAEADRGPTMAMLDRADALGVDDLIPESVPLPSENALIAPGGDAAPPSPADAGEPPPVEEPATAAPSGAVTPAPPAPADALAGIEFVSAASAKAASASTAQAVAAARQREIARRGEEIRGNTRVAADVLPAQLSAAEITRRRSTMKQYRVLETKVLPHGSSQVTFHAGKTISRQHYPNLDALLAAGLKVEEVA